MNRLHPQHLTTLPAEVARPAYDRERLQNGIVHLGLGAFMRAHMAAATEAAIAAGDLRWGIVGVSLRQPDTRDALAPQDGLYTLAIRDADAQDQPRQRLQVIGAVRSLLVAPENPGAVLDAIAAADARIVSLTVTEKGYCHDPATGALRLDHPDIVHDLANPAAPRSAIGVLVVGLQLRYALGHGPLTLMSLDNLPANGRVLRGAVLSFAEALDPALARRIAADCRFPCSMVDRIVPRTTDADRAAVSQALGCEDRWPVLGEPFFDWAVEDDFAADRPDWTLGGARFVADAEPFERLKLRMVNGTHSSIAYLGAMAGWQTVDKAIAQAPLREHIEALMRDEIEPTLAELPGLDLPAYRANLLARYANPALAHRTRQIAMDGSQKLPQRLLCTVRDRLAQGLPVPRMALGVAAWMHYLRGVDELGNAYAIDDPHAAELTALYQRTLGQGASTEAVQAMLSYAPVFGDLAGNEPLATALLRALQSLQTRGVPATLVAVNHGELAQ
ncbi:MAG: mannitol dehydrogenase [Burkholderiales bacterium RIFCSPLOWO2_12_67_14]|nr:MAG: mannitol dehydrogenase [Burkholderiales bacterium RIFCSPLOWO2_02_FULL_67_64]OGB39158.1 MAG: mannitol dehydrogenase [Burkholderiales bacterium RIFCSPHIGHO2_12_FULL_67_38]OGB40460.1 MAG: mannitol dehydrogenase [Burkholderiales bacterium RIFCSPLOWO2_12_67_14]OGB80181.1 MAG: mannitol dehydrogenase [Burkholderiales bacterium RIFCSPLOWO2_12_FULL_67_210]